MLGNFSLLYCQRGKVVLCLREAQFLDLHLGLAVY